MKERVVNNHFYHMVHKKEEGAYHRIEKQMKEMPGFLSPRRGLPLLLIPEYSGINKEQRIPDRSKTAHRKPPVKCFLTITNPSPDTQQPCLLLLRLMASLDLSPGGASSESPRSNPESMEIIRKIGGAQSWEVKCGQPGVALLSPASWQGSWRREGGAGKVAQGRWHRLAA